MKNKKSIFWIITIGIIFIFNSCSTTELSVNKRRYNKGFYVDFKNNNVEKTDKIVKSETISKEEIKAEKSLTNESINTLSASSNNDDPSLFVEKNETKTFQEKVKNEEIKNHKIDRKALRKSILKKSKNDSNPETTKVLSLLSFIFGLVGVFIPFIGIAALVLGLIALNQYKKLDDFLENKWMAITGLILGAVMTFIYLVVILVWFMALAILI